MDKNYLSISRRLEEYRKLMNLNQEQMGEKLGVNQSHYSKLEAGLKGVSYRNLKCFEENGGDSFFLITGEHRVKGRLDHYLEQFRSGYGKSRVFEILVWAAETGRGYADRADIVLTERTDKCIRLLRDYSKNLTIWRNIRKTEGCSQEEMANKFDINIKRYRNIEQEKSMPDAEILRVLYEKLHYSPLVILDREMYYMDELNRMWEMLPPEYLRETEILVEQAIKIIHISETGKMEG